jgi:Fe-S oxidoreductase
MAGSYGYERKHYDMSKKIAHSVLIPAIEKAGSDTIIAAPGTSCREQISHFSKRKAQHPIEVLYNAIVNIK